jgi:hypothetical protein
MTRGFDVFDRDDFRTPHDDSERGMGSGSTSSWDKWRELQNIHREEERSDALAREAQQRSSRERPPVPREQCVRVVMEQRTRTAFTDRNRTYSLRDSEIYTMTEVGKFRVVAKNDLAEFAYNGDRDRMENDVESLVRQGLAKVTPIADTEYNQRKVVTLTKEGHRFLSRGKVLPRGQAIYHSLKKPREANHDGDLYRLYHKVADEIESQGGRVIRVQLDYELKEELYSRLARTSQDKTRNPRTSPEEIANRYHLRVVSGKVPIPDLRVEYVRENDNEIQRRDLELATDHYRPQGLSEKARAGFQIYAKPGETDRLRRIRNEQELTAAILSL